MQPITTSTDLLQAIAQLEIKQDAEKIELQNQFKLTYESLKPLNLIKNTLTQLVATPQINTSMINSAVSLGLGYISKKIVVGEQLHPLKQLVGSLVQMGVTNIVAKNTTAIQTGILNFIKKFVPLKNDVEQT